MGSKTILHIAGPITPASAQLFIHNLVICDSPCIDILINCTGGFIPAATAIAAAIASRQNIEPNVRITAICSCIESAAILVWSAAKRRILHHDHAYLMFHIPTIHMPAKEYRMDELMRTITVLRTYTNMMIETLAENFDTNMERIKYLVENQIIMRRRDLEEEGWLTDG